METDVTISQKEKLSQRLRTRRLLSITSIGIGLAGIVAAAFVIPEIQSPAVLPKLEALKAGTYVPAQVVFKVKPGKSAASAIQRLVGKKQTMYKKNGADIYVPLAEAEKVTNDTTYQKTSVALHQKSVQQLFPEPKLTDAVREKILRRPGASDPKESYKRLKLDRWYVATVEEAHADVAQMVRQLKSDTSFIESVTPNTLNELMAVQTDTDQEVTSSSGSSTSTTCDNPNDPYSCSYGHLSISSVADQWSLNAVNAREAWLYTHGTPKTTIAVIDSGVDFRHPELKKNIWLNSPEDINQNGCAEYWPPIDFSGHVSCSGETTYSGGDMNGLDEDGNGYVDDVNGIDLEGDMTVNDDTQGPDDTVGHGTGVASIIAAETNSSNTEGIAGLCWTCTLMPIAIESLEDERIVAGLNYAANNGADVVNLSLGGVHTYPEQSPLLPALEYVKSLGVIVVAAAGNSDQDLSNPAAPLLPANSSAVIAVGAVDQSENRWHKDRSSSGEGNGSNWGNNLSIMAPGVEILQALAHILDTKVPWAYSGFVCQPLSICIIPSNEPYAGFPNRNYRYATGTSFSAPIVSGIIGLMKSTNPSLGPDEIKRILESTATDMTDVVDENGNEMTGLVGWDKYSGYGLVNAEAAVREAYNSRPDFSVTATPGVSPIIASGPNQLHLDFFIENRGRTTAENVPYRLISTDTNTTYFNGWTRTLFSNSTSSLYETISVSTPIPTHLQLVIDPDNVYPEPFESDNKSESISVLPYGTPIINNLANQKVSTITPVAFVVSATDPNTPAVELVYTVKNLPPGASFVGQQFTWTPDSDTPSQNLAPNFTVTDSTGLSSTRTVAIEFINPTDSNLLPPVFVALNEELGIVNTINIHTETNILSSVIINYGLTSSYGTHSSDQVPRLNHANTLTVEANTTYHYQVQTCSQTLKCRFSEDRTFLTPVIPSIATPPSVTTDDTREVATVSWTNNVPASGHVKDFYPDIQNIQPTATGGPVLTDIILGPNEISWKTDYLTDARIDYDSKLPTKNFSTNIHYSKEHHLILPDLVFGLDYYFAISSCTHEIGLPVICTNSKLSTFSLGKDVVLMQTNPLLQMKVVPDTKYTYTLVSCVTQPWCFVEKGFSFLTASAVTFEPVAPLSVPSKKLITFNVNAHDSQGQQLVYSAANLPTGSTFNPETREFSWIPELIQENSTAYKPVFTACTSLVIIPTATSRSCNSLEVSIQVLPTVLQFNTIPDQTVYKGVQFTIGIGQFLSNPENTEISYSGTVPSGATLNKQTGLLTWTDPAQQSLYPGYYSIQVIASDNFGRQASQGFRLYVVIPEYICPIGYSITSRSTFGASTFASDACGGTEYTANSPYGSGQICRSKTPLVQKIRSTRTMFGCKVTVGQGVYYNLIIPTPKLPTGTKTTQ